MKISEEDVFRKSAAQLRDFKNARGLSSAGHSSDQLIKHIIERIGDRWPTTKIAVLTDRRYEWMRSSEAGVATEWLDHHDDLESEAVRQSLLSTSLIVLDLQMQRSAEQQSSMRSLTDLVAFLASKHYSGGIVCDGIYSNQQTHGFWAKQVCHPSIKAAYDLSTVGHITGSGLLDVSDMFDVFPLRANLKVIAKDPVAAKPLDCTQDLWLVCFLLVLDFGCSCFVILLWFELWLVHFFPAPVCSHHIVSYRCCL